MFNFSKKAPSVKMTEEDFDLSLWNIPKERQKVALQKLEVYFKALLQEFVDWSINSKEITNFSYEVSPLDIAYLPSFLAVACGTPNDELAAYIEEALGDDDLRAHYRENLKSNQLSARLDDELRLGRRLGWYAAVRAMKPKVVVESGVEAGFGALALLAALRRNGAEGHVGQYIGIDIAPWAGSLIGGVYAENARMIQGDSIKSIEELDCEVDLFVSDSDHSREYERGEYEAISTKLSSTGLIIADNAHVTNELQLFADRTGRRFLYFQEHPVKHWSRMAPPGIGICFN